MKSLVTGANGFVGSAVVRCLLAAGHEVRAFVRPNSDRRNLIKLPIETIEGDLRDVTSIKRAVASCDSLFHVAADYRLWVPNPSIMYDVNVNGTKSLILESAEAGMDRMVYTSSVATLGLNPNSLPADEETPSNLASIAGHYKRSKFLAEQLVQELVRQHQLPLVTVNPSTPIGPRDVKPTPTGRIVLDTLRGKMPAYVDTGLNVAHVDDIAYGHLLAYRFGKPGERYILGGDNMTLLQILQTIDELTCKPTKRRSIPVKLMLPIAHTMEVIARITKTEPRATVDSIHMAKKKMFFTSAKAERELGYQSRPAVHAIQDAIDWFKSANYC
ncbi:MAG TPA: NAD-dependent dehydratase [Nitrosomonas nitrosa]|uniref:hopanoid-associated sugar epimerase n=1 Tax=Nitrosomonas nitrosa TaxID=52442 RepID=UPI000D30DDDE|nr:hopanoid-associated sugar epimerase [Nitrosomonas nitrosa]MCO6433626.1 NAD-dependent epimerase/dehydratase family protein [Nitrosomonas nitrosa]HBZ30347.1 NAD-dependent dehydratase [Nitrosomonas nitrosa]